MIKAVFFDVDNTLLSHKTHCVPQSTYDSLLKLKEKGIKVFMSTGRHTSELPYLPIDNLEFDGYVTLNGQLCFNKRKELVYSNPFNNYQQTILSDLFKSKAFPMMFVEENDLYVNVVTDTVRKAQAAISSPVPPIKEYHHGLLYQVSIYLNKDQEKAIVQKLPDDCKVSWWNANGIDLIPLNSGKEKGIAYFLQELNILPEEAMAFGDSENDIQMLEYVGVGVAMGNGSNDVKQAADYITSDIDDDGIKKALEHYKLI